MPITKNEQSKLESIRASSEILASNIVDFLRAERQRALSENDVSLDIKATKDITSTLRDLVGIIRDVNAIPDHETRQKNALASERLALARSQLELRRELIQSERDSDSAPAVRIIMEPALSEFLK